MHSAFVEITAIPWQFWKFQIFINYSFLRWIFIIWLFIVFIIVNFLRMFDHFIVVQFISNKKILCIIWPFVFDHPVFYGFHISSVLTNHVVKKTITNIKYYTLVDFFSVKLWQMKLKFYTMFFFSLLLPVISSGVRVFVWSYGKLQE